MKATVKDVAERAGVSLGSVSRVLNGAPTAGDAVTARVRRAIEELGYRPLRRRKQAAVGRSLRGRSVGLVLLGMHKSLVSLPSVADAVEGAEAMLSAAGALTVLYNIPDPASPPDHFGRSPADASQPRPTAVFCPADSITRQLYKACAMGGIEPGRDLSIISASFEDASAMLHPSLTSIDIHPDAVGRRTVELLEWRLAHRDEPEVQITIAPSLVEGQSVRTLPARGRD